MAETQIFSTLRGFFQKSGKHGLNHNGHSKDLQATESVSGIDQSELLSNLFDGSPESIHVQGRNGVIERINAAGVALLEAPDAKSVTGTSLFDRILPRYHESLLSLIRKAFTGHSGRLEYEVTTFNGNQRWMEAYFQPLRSQAGQDIAALLVTTRDISKRKAMLRQLEGQRNHLHTIIESEPECVKLQNMDGVIVEMNPAGLALLRAESAEQVLGRNIYDFLTPEYHKAYENLTENVFKGERGCMEYEIVALDGERHWVEAHAAPLYDADGQISALLAVTRDIDERKLAAEKLRQQQAELAHVCRLSTMGEMATGLAHELNQPLCAISSYAESAELSLTSDSATQENEQLRSLLQKIVAQTVRANGIIQQLRQFIRKRTPKPQATDIRLLMDNVVRFCEQELSQSHVNLELALSPDLPCIMVDRVQIEQVMINLISNGVQAMKEILPEERRISVAIDAEPNGQVRFSVADQGAGVSEAVSEQMFTPFFSTKQSGLGMGLAISRTIVEAHGGRIWYAREQDKGTQFHFTLPAGSV